jgi:hypothetical protein
MVKCDVRNTLKGTSGESIEAMLSVESCRWIWDDGDTGGTTSQDATGTDRLAEVESRESKSETFDDWTTRYICTTWMNRRWLLHVSSERHKSSVRKSGKALCYRQRLAKVWCSLGRENLSRLRCISSIRPYHGCCQVQLNSCCSFSLRKIRTRSTIDSRWIQVPCCISGRASLVTAR